MFFFSFWQNILGILGKNNWWLKIILVEWCLLNKQTDHKIVTHVNLVIIPLSALSGWGLMRGGKDLETMLWDLKVWSSLNMSCVGLKRVSTYIIIQLLFDFCVHSAVIPLLLNIRGTIVKPVLNFSKSQLSWGPASLLYICNIK